MLRIRKIFKGIFEAIGSIFTVGYVCGQDESDLEIEKEDDRNSAINKELERLWERYEDCWSSTEKEELLKHIKDLEDKL